MAKSNLDKSVGHLLRRAQQYSFDMYADQVGTGGLTPRQFAVLQAVSENPGLSQTDLVKRTGIDRSTLADMISRMLKKGVLARHRTKSDARANSVSVTASGKRAMKGAAAKVAKADRDVLKAVPKAQQAGFMKALTAISAQIDKEMNAASTAKKSPAKKSAKRKTAKRKTRRKTAKRSKK